MREDAPGEDRASVRSVAALLLRSSARSSAPSPGRTEAARLPSIGTSAIVPRH